MDTGESVDPISVSAEGAGSSLEREDSVYSTSAYSTDAGESDL
jgi:hypothetical protein